jgi:hypothetical protein
MVVPMQEFVAVLCQLVLVIGVVASETGQSFFFFAIYIKGVLSVKYSNGAVYLGEVEMVYYLARIYY